MKNLKSNFLLPVAAFMIAIAAAFATQMEEQDAFALEQGYIYENNVCIPSGKCANTSGPVCTDDLERQVFGKSGPTECFKQLRMEWHP